jgi:glucoamylase
MGNGQAPAPDRQAAQSWTSGAKDLVMTALGSSRIWATLARGIVTEVYWPAVDQPQVKDLGFLAAGDGWWREVKRVNRYSLSTPDPALALPTIVHTSTAPDYQLVLRPVVDPVNDTLLVAYDLQGAGARLYPLLAPHLGVSRPTDESSWPSLGADNLAWVDPNGQGLLASGSGRYLCLQASTGFRTASAGYVGSSDGWTDFAHNQAMRWSYASAGPGVVALIGELAAGTGLLALGFGDSEAAARGSCQASLAAGYDATAAAFRPGWQAWTARTAVPPAPAGRSLPAGVPAAVRQSAAVLRTHADHAAVGAYVAGLAIPWGEDTNDPGGYHLVWCRDAGESALALAAAGHVDDAVAVLGYLLAHQSPDGSWPRCAYVDGSAMPGAVQLDEVAFPVLLAGQLAELGTALPAGADAAIRRAATYLAQQGPVSDRDVDRWEENPGASPFTLGLEIVAMVVAAGHLTGSDRDLALALADSWNERLEEFTYRAGSDLDREFGTSGHYVRIGLPGGDRVGVGNQPGGPLSIEAAALVGMEFLYLPRLGLRDPPDSRITDTVAVVEAMLSRRTPNGTAYYRYDVDGYGEWIDGSGWPRRHFGIGRPWPLLAGERGHYDVLAGGDGSAQLQAMLEMRGRGGLLPEQVWDTNPLPWRQLRNGQPSGSAMPLAWAHSELIKLAVTAATGRPVEMLRQVSDRYAAKVPTAATWYWRDSAPVVALPAGRSLVIADSQPFGLHSGFDAGGGGWQQVTNRDAQPLGLGLHGVVFTPADLTGHTSLHFVRQYDAGWEPSSGHAITLQSTGAPAVRLSTGRLGRAVAAGLPV